MPQPLGDALRSAMRRWATGVTVVTARRGERRTGMTVSAFFSVSLSPPTVVVSLHEGAPTLSLIRESMAFGVSILPEDAGELSVRFAAPDRNGADDRFAGLAVHEGETGVPLLADALAWLDCRVLGLHPAGTHVLVLGTVVAARDTGSKAGPLLYYDRAYRSVARPPA